MKQISEKEYGHSDYDKLKDCLCKELEKENEALKQEAKLGNIPYKEAIKLRKENALLKEWNTVWKESHAILQKSLSEDKGEVCECKHEKEHDTALLIGMKYCPWCGKPIKEE